MVLSIVAYGDPVLKRVAEDIDKEYPDLSGLIESMYETMYHAQGVGLAAPQVGKSIRLFIVDGAPFKEEDSAAAEFKGVFINPRIIEETGDEWIFNEGCLSIPGIREDIQRPPEILISYYDENWVKREQKINGLPARIVQHEYDHLEGVLFTDRLSALKKRLLKRKLSDITKGDVEVDYRMKFPNRKR